MNGNVSVGKSASVESSEFPDPEVPVEDGSAALEDYSGADMMADYVDDNLPVDLTVYNTNNTTNRLILPSAAPGVALWNFVHLEERYAMNAPVDTIQMFVLSNFKYGLSGTVISNFRSV